MKTSTKFLALFLAVFMALSLSACADSDGPTNTGAPPSDAPGPSTETPAGGDPVDDVEKVLRIGTYLSPADWQPWTQGSDGDKFIQSQIYEALVEFDNVNYQPILAESWEPSADGLTWTFHLREDACWQRGNDLFGDELVPVTAADVKACLEWIMDPENGAKRQAELAETIESIEATDEHTLVFHNKQFDALFLYKISRNFIFPVQAMETGYDLTVHPVGSGAFKFESYALDDEVVLVKNEDYFMAPNVDKVVFKIIPDKSVLAISLQNDEIDVALQILGTEVGAIAADENLILAPANRGSLRSVLFNCSDPLFEDAEIRRAVSMLVDMNSMVNAIFANDAGATLAVRAYGPIPLELPGADEAAWINVCPVYDPDGAKAILESKGWTLGSDGIYEKGGKKFSFTLVTGNNDAAREKLAVMIATQLQSAGIACTAQTVEYATMTSDIKAGNYQMAINGGASSLDGINMIASSTKMKTASFNTFWASEEADNFLAQAWATVDDAARAALLSQASQVVVRECVNLFAYFEYTQVGINQRVLGFVENPTVWYSLCCYGRNIDIAVD